MSALVACLIWNCCLGSVVDGVAKAVVGGTISVTYPNTTEKGHVGLVLFRVVIRVRVCCLRVCGCNFDMCGWFGFEKRVLARYLSNFMVAGGWF